MRPKSRKQLARERDTRLRLALIRGDYKASFAYTGKPKPPYGTVARIASSHGVSRSTVYRAIAADPAKQTAPCHPFTLIAHTRGPEWVDTMSDAEVIALYHLVFGRLPPGLEGLAA